MSLNVVSFPQRDVLESPQFVSKWQAINHAIIFGMERQDYTVQLFYNYTTKVMVAVITFGTMIDSPIPGDEIYIESPSNSGTFTLATYLAPNIFIMEPQAIAAPPFGSSGFINLLSRKNYFIRTNVWGVNENNQYELIGQSRNKPDNTGRVTVDVSSFLKNLVDYQDFFQYDKLNERDDTLGSPYNITYSENWQLYEGSFSNLSATLLRWGVNSAKQIQEIYGANMGEYVPFWINLLTPVPYAKFLSDFKEPTYFPGFPFSLSFIYSEYLVGIETFRNQETFDINGNLVQAIAPIKLFNSEAQEVNRLMIDEDNFPSTINFSEVWLETEGNEDCLEYLVPGYIQVGYVKSICGLPIVTPPPNVNNPTI
jgi:hypothetical protein